MRLLQRNFHRVALVEPIQKRDAFGGCTVEYSGARRVTGANVVPSTAAVRDEASGLVLACTVALLMPPEVCVAVGDGICIDTENPEWRCIAVERWRGHTAVRAARIAGNGEAVVRA